MYIINGAKTERMRLIRQQASKAARVFPVGDAQGIRLNPVRSGQVLLGYGRAQLKKLYSSCQSRHVECWDIDGKRKGVWQT